MKVYSKPINEWGYYLEYFEENSPKCVCGV